MQPTAQFRAISRGEENGLIAISAKTNVGPQISLQFDYDWKSRRVRKQVWGNANWSGAPTNDIRFVYDGCNLIGIVSTNSTLLSSFAWGLDLSCSPQGAGGVGGLLWVSEVANCPITNSFFAAFDGNGNVMALVNAGDGAPSAQYEYGPFGELLRASGSMAKANPFRFSTKYQDDETDLLYYGYRYYNPSTGRWINKDPLEERGGLNQYGFVGENPVCTSDRFGLFRDDFMTCPCRCVSVDVTYNPGGNSPPASLAIYSHWFDDFFGSRITVHWNVTGTRSFCKYYQDETGTSGILTGPGVNIVVNGGNHEVPFAYTDYMGAVVHEGFLQPPVSATYNFILTWRVVFRCVSSTEDGYVVERSDSAYWNQNFNYP